MFLVLLRPSGQLFGAAWDLPLAFLEQEKIPLDPPLLKGEIKAKLSRFPFPVSNSIHHSLGLRCAQHFRVLYVFPRFFPAHQRMQEYRRQDDGHAQIEQWRQFALFAQ